MVWIHTDEQPLPETIRQINAAVRLFSAVHQPTHKPMGHQLEVVVQLRTLRETQLAAGGLKRRADRGPTEDVRVAETSFHRSKPLHLPLIQQLQSSQKLSLPRDAAAIGSEQCLQCCVGKGWHRQRPRAPRMPQAEAMAQTPNPHGPWSGRRIGITGARGSLGRALTQALRERGAVVTGLTHGDPPKQTTPDGPDQWVRWSCGEEAQLDACLADLDILVINHGINPQGQQQPEDVDRALEINALSSWRLMQRFEQIAYRPRDQQPRELWVNTSEAEIQPAISPVYELSKRLIGQLVSLRGANLSAEQRRSLRIRKLVLGPFRSELNPIGVMSAGFVARQVLVQARLNLSLIIVTPNPLTYLLMPLNELARWSYSKAFSRRDP